MATDNTDSAVVEVQRFDDQYAVTVERVTADERTWHEVHVRADRRGWSGDDALAPEDARSFAAMIQAAADTADRLDREAKAKG
jgi:hypothetical protein